MASPTPIDDSLQARISSDCPSTTQQILYHAWARDLSGLKPLLNVPGHASIQDPTTGETPLHAAIRSCGPADPNTTTPATGTTEGEDAEIDGAVEEAIEAVRELFFSGAIWNDVDNNNETPGCVAWRLGRQELYNLCLEAGVRAEMLFGLLDGYERLSSGAEEDEDEEANGEDAAAGAEAEIVAGGGAKPTEAQEAAEEPVLEIEQEPEKRFQPPESGEKEIKSEEYLRSTLTYSDGKLVDDEGNGVMMAWETDIMRRSVDTLLPGLEPGKRILNIGLGMGIIDSMFADTKPAKHHIIEAHPAVLDHLSKPDAKFGSQWEQSGPEEGAFKVHRGRWQDVLPTLLEKGEMYDAIYFDTFGEDYSQLRLFFTEFVPGLLDFEGRFGFFNGLGADRRICYDVYSRVVEMHLSEAGLDLDWEVIDVDMEGLEEAGKGEWEGVRRRYWTLDKYRLPTCTFMG
ncbi:Arginine N-methyltransferase 2 [Scedosporium apiospermum]|uniref:Arginine N-methyltransferase 2 n=1 Tax=Pseudallescheria apiosperma TaxID=563466 RepID=A0A084GAK1_PSEDA|nr:Arginine N-methyltransferase 2 [Scedosporium apiospermum]KEZ44363.1 Arginine N-methyltransferase 2 [Scedosporium apiospermum]